jgi:hypothetical protein
MKAEIEVTDPLSLSLGVQAMADLAAGASPGEVPESTKQQQSETKAVSPRVWPAALLIVAFWTWFVLLNLVLDMVISYGFLMTALGAMATVLLFFVWWLAASRVPAVDRVGFMLLSVVAATLAVLVSLKTLTGQVALFMGLPLMMTLWCGWLLVSGRLSWPARRLGLAAVIVAVWALVASLRIDGVAGRMTESDDLHWRWTPTAEEEYLAARERGEVAAAAATPLITETLTLATGDWPGFRGPAMRGAQTHEPIATDWKASPPKQLWKRPIGPSWASVVVVGDKLFTHEQRGEDEATVCLDAATGKEIWAHLDKARFWDGQAGAGPRGTPLFYAGKLYTYGATGILNCLDAATGKLLWKRDVAAETKAPLPMWGFSSSPVVVGEVVVVFAGAPEENGLIAYRADSGEPAWHVATGPISYSSAQPINIDGADQVVLMDDYGISGVDPASGKKLWSYEAPANGIWRVAQPRQMAEGAILVGSEDLGLRMLEISREGDGWKVNEAWQTKQMRPAFNDFVTVGDVAYGFDKGLFCATDLKSGKRLWKGGRFGFGQVLLLEPQNVLVVLGEQGEVVLLNANPEKLEELGRIEALSGKTWNHPVVAHGRLYVRNDNEMAAFELAPAGKD